MLTLKVIIILGMLSLANNEKPTVQLKNGLRIIGTLNKTPDLRKSYYAYRGIPFAQPPIGNLRFRSPVPLHQNLSGQIINAFDDKSQCVQVSVTVQGSEDCLFINVYTPLTGNSSKLLPVMVWIHGGGFITGNSSYALYGPDYLINENVVVVSFNYRLGVFGFLSTEDQASPGNYGLKDQVLALHWVQENIVHFGGNRSRVTVFGESAGAASISYLSQTPITKGLFHGAILESGNSISPWALTRNPRNTAYIVAKHLKLNTSSTQALVDALRKVDYRSLAVVQSLLVLEDVTLHNWLLNGLIIGPTVEPPSSDAIIKNDSFELLKNGLFSRIPYLIGFNSIEAISVQVTWNLPSFVIKLTIPNALVPISMNLNDNTIKLTVNQIIKDYYFGIFPVVVSKKQAIEYFSDNAFCRPIIQSALLCSQYSPVYFYEFSYYGSLGSGKREFPGAGHTDELYYLFRKSTYNGNPTKMDLITRYRMVKLWTNFAKTGNPTPDKDQLLQNVTWPLANTDGSFNLRYLNISGTLTTMLNPKWEQFVFWTDLFKRFGNPPYSTY